MQDYIDLNHVFFNFRLAVAKVRAGEADCKIAFVGDSTTAGVGSSMASTIPSLKSQPSCFCKLLNEKVPASIGLAVPPSILSGNPDQRWTAGDGWSLTTFGAGSGADWESHGATTPLTYQDSRVEWDNATVYYLTNNGLGTINVSVLNEEITSQPASVAQSCSATAGVGAITVTAASANANNVVSIVGNGDVHIVGVETFNSQTKSVRVGNLGVGSSTTTNWINNSTNFGGIPLLEAYAPNLTVISLGINDAGQNTTTSTYISNMVTLITAAQSLGDVIIVTMPPSITASEVAIEEEYIAALYGIAESMNIPIVDIFKRFGSVYCTPLMNDNVHPNDLGYEDWAAALVDYISEII